MDVWLNGFMSHRYIWIKKNSNSEDKYTLDNTFVMSLHKAHVQHKPSLEDADFTDDSFHVNEDG